MGPAQKRLLVFPHRSDDPYQNLLHLAPRAAGWQIRTSNRFSAFMEQLASVETGEVVHLHWSAWILQTTRSESDAAARLHEFQSGIDTALGRGALVIWTIHHLTPLECSYPELERELGRFLADRATSIHVLSERGEAEARQQYEILPGKIIRMPRASYVGIYDHALSRSEARCELGLADDEKAVLFFGRMRASMGIEVLCRAVQRAGERGENVVLLLAGETRDEDREAVERSLPDAARVIRDPRYVPDGSVQDWYAAADVVVLPNRNALNSGSLLLAATYGVPVILPRPEPLPELDDAEPWLTFYDASNEQTAVAALTAAIVDFDDPRHVARDSALAFAAGRVPFSMSRRYLAALLGCAD